MEPLTLINKSKPYITKTTKENGILTEEDYMFYCNGLSLAFLPIFHITKK